MGRHAITRACVPSCLGFLWPVYRGPDSGMSFSASFFGSVSAQNRQMAAVVCSIAISKRPLAACSTSNGSKTSRHEGLFQVILTAETCSD